MSVNRCKAAPAHGPAPQPATSPPTVVALLAVLTFAGFAVNPAQAQGHPAPSVDLPTALTAADAASARSDWRTERNAFRQACDLGSPRACLKLSILEYRGRGGPVDRATAVQRSAAHRKAVDDACLDRDALACVTMGHLHAQGVGLPKDPTAAVRYLHLACSLGAAAGCSAWGDFLAAGKVTPRDEPAALALYERACQNGIPDACALRGAELVHGVDLSGDPTAAHQWFTLGCARGSRVGCHNLAVLLLKGAGCRADPAAAAGHWRTACNGGYAPSCTGMAAQAWPQVKPDEPCPAEALPWLDQGCAVGDPKGCYWLGRCHENPADGQRNVVLVAQAYREACEREHGQGCRRLSELYLSGEVAAPATPQTRKVHELACQAGDGAACREVAKPPTSAIALALGSMAVPVPHVVLGDANPLVLAWPIRPVAFPVLNPTPGRPLPSLLLLPSLEPQYRFGRGWRFAGIVRGVLAKMTEEYSSWGLMAEAGVVSTSEKVGGVAGAGLEYGKHGTKAQVVGGLGVRLTRFEDRLEAALVLDFHAGGVVAGGR